MKKLLVLALVVSMLAVTASAFALETWTAPTSDYAGHYNTLLSIKNSNGGLAGHFDSSSAELAEEWMATYLKTSNDVGAVATAAAKIDSAVSNTLSSSGYTVLTSAEAPTASVVAAMMAKNKVESGKTIQAYALPRLSTATMKPNTQYAICIDDSIDADKVKSLNGTSLDLFAASRDESSLVEITKTNGNMWLMFAKASDKTISDKYYTTDKMSGVSAGDQLLLGFVYSADASTYVKGAADTGYFSGAFTTESASVTVEQKAAGGSGGGCVAGTSAAALALAVLGFVTAKRRA